MSNQEDGSRRGDHVGDPGPPGHLLTSGVTYRPVASLPRLELDEAARHQVFEKMESVAEAVRRGIESGVSAYVR